MNPTRDRAKMKCLLLLLTFQLVCSDKLDRTYLPPPNAQYAGGDPEELKTPLEYLITGTAQNGQPVSDINEGNEYEDASANLDLDMSKTIDYSNPEYSNVFGQRNPFSSSGYGSSDTTSRPITSNSYDNFPLNQPILGYLPSKQSTSNSQQFSLPSNVMFKTLSPYKNLDEKSSDYFYYVPKMPFYENTKQKNFKPNNNINFGQYPKQRNEDIMAFKEFIPKKATINDIVQNYEPNAFGYYGGNPMIMTTKILPQEYEDVALTSKFGEYEKLPIQTTDEDKINTNARTTPKPFQTPLVRSNIQKGYSKKPQFRTTTISPRRNNSPIEINQRSNIPSRKLKPERPLAESDRKAVIISYENDLNSEGFSYSFDTSNGIHADESGTAINGVRAKGSYSYTGDDGKTYTVSYTADENGFQPKGDHLPTPPPVPEAIKKVIEQAARNRAAGIIDDGFYDEKKYGYRNYQGAMDRYYPFTYNKVPNVSKRIRNNKTKSNNNIKKLNENTGRVPLIADKPNGNINRGSIVSEEFQSRFDSGANNNNAEEIHTQGEIDSLYRLQIADNKKNQQVNTKSGTSRMSSELTSRESNQNKPMTQTNVFDQVEKNYRTKPNIFFQTQNPLNYKSDIRNVVNFNNNIQDQPNGISKKINTPTAGIFNDDGYYYVPPFMKFDPVSNKPLNKKDNYVTNVIPKEETLETTVSKRIDIENDQNKQIFDQRAISTEVLYNNTITYSDTKPYIDNTKNDKDFYYDDSNESNPFGFENQENQDDSITLYASTTPMPAQTTQIENQQNNGYFYPNPYDNTFNNPAVFETIQNVVENRVNFPIRTPGVTVSQDFVTTTIKPSLLNDGVLEVNQNVKIYGLGSTEPTVAFNIPEKDKYNNKYLYTTAVPSNEEFRFGIYPEQILQPNQDTSTYQGNINQVYDSEFLTNRGLFDAVIPMNEPTTPLNSFYSQQNFETRLEGESEFPKNSYLAANDKNTEFKTQETIPTVTIQSKNPIVAAIAEDFSGPKQSQKYDPLMGYYYK